MPGGYFLSKICAVCLQNCEPRGRRGEGKEAFNEPTCTPFLAEAEYIYNFRSLNALLISFNYSLTEIKGSKKRIEQIMCYPVSSPFASLRPQKTYVYRDATMFGGKSFRERERTNNE